MRTRNEGRKKKLVDEDKENLGAAIGEFFMRV